MGRIAIYLRISAPETHYSRCVHVNHFDSAVLVAQGEVEFSLNPMQALGIPIALVGAVFLSLGTQMQHRGVTVAEEARGKTENSMGLAQVKSLLASPMWVAGTVIIGLAVVLQLTALALAPLLVVQPLGAIALVVTAVLNARIHGLKLDRHTVTAIFWCVGGIGVFVTVAAIFAVESTVEDHEVFTVLGLLLVVTTSVVLIWLRWRSQINAIISIIFAGTLYGFLVTLMKIVMNRIQLHGFDWIIIACLSGVIVSLLLGMYFVQLAHASGPPDLAIAGLTVIDPLVAVLIGVAVMGEAVATPPWAIIFFAFAGGCAIYGVFQLAKHHPQLQS